MSDIKKEYGFEDEANWKEVISDPSRWFGIYYLLLLFGIIAAGITYLNNMNDIFKAEVDNKVILNNEITEEEKNNDFLVKAKYEEMQAMGDEKALTIGILLAKIETNSSASAKLLKMVTSDMKLALMTLSNDSRWKTNYDVFNGLIRSNMPHNGFNSRYTELSKDQVLSIHSLLVGHFNSASNSDIDNTESSAS